MRNKNVKKIVSWFLVFTMIILLKPMKINAATSNKLIVENYKVVNNGVIYKGNVFKVEISIKNISNEDAKDVQIGVQPCSFSPKDSGNIIAIGSIAKGKTLSKTIEFKYNGGADNNIYFNIKSDLGVTDDCYMAVDTYAENPTNSDGTPLDTKKIVPKLKIDSANSLSLEAGTTATFSLMLKNIGKYGAKEVLVNSVVSEALESESITSKFIGDLQSKKEKSFNYTLRVKSSAQAQTYPLTLKYSYENMYGDSFEASEIIYIKVTKPSFNIDLDVDNIRSSPAVIKSGNNFTLSLDIKNNGNDTAKNVSVALVGLSSEGFALSSGKTSQVISAINGGSKKTLTFNLNADYRMKSGNSMLKARVVYTNGTDEKKSDEHEFYLKVEGKDSYKTPILSIENMVYPTSQLVPGKIFTVAFDVANSGDGEAENVTVIADGGENMIAKSQSTQVIRKIPVNSSKTVYFKFQPQDKLSSKSYLINIEVKNSKNEVVQSVKQYVGVEVGQKSDIIIGAIQQSSYVVRPNEGFTVSFPVTNRGIGVTKNIKVSINGGEGIITRSGSTQIISVLGPGKTQHVSFNLQASKGATTRNYPIGIEVKYEGAAETTIKENTSIYVEKNPDENAKGVPRIIISRYSAEPAIVKAGSNFELELSFLNTNFVKPVKNVKVYLTVDEKSNKTGNVFTPVNSSNTFYIDSISPKQIENKKITLYTIPDASAKTYTIMANLEYEDEKGTQYKAQELIGIPVAQPSKLQIGDVQMPTEIFAGQPMSISTEFYNVGKVTLSNLMVRAEGNFNIQKANYFVGNFDIGASDTYEVEITPKAPGDLKGFVIFSYDETNGEHVEIKKPIAAKVTEMPPMPAMPGEEMQAGANKSSKWKKIIAAVGAVVVIAGVGIIVHKKRKKKKEEEGLSADE